MLDDELSLPNRYIHFVVLIVFLEGVHCSYYEHKSETKFD